MSISPLIKDKLPADLPPSAIDAAVELRTGLESTFGGETLVLRVNGALRVLTRDSSLDPFTEITLAPNAPLVYEEHADDGSERELRVHAADGREYRITPSFLEVNELEEILGGVIDEDAAARGPDASMPPAPTIPSSQAPSWEPTSLTLGGSSIGAGPAPSWLTDSRFEDALGGGRNDSASAAEHHPYAEAEAAEPYAHRGEAEPYADRGEAEPYAAEPTIDEAGPSSSTSEDPLPAASVFFSGAAGAGASAGRATQGSTASRGHARRDPPAAEPPRARRAPEPSVEEEVEQVMLRQGRISAIRVYRERTGAGLAEARDAVTRITGQAPAPQEIAAGQTGNSFKVVVLLCFAFLIYKFFF